MKKFGVLSLLLVMLLCIGLTATGCMGSTDSGDDTTLDDITSDDTTSDDTTDDGNDEDEAEELIGEVAYVGSSYITISLYTVDAEIDDYTELDVSELTEDGTTEYIYISSSTEYYTVDSGALVSGSADDVAEGDMIVASVVYGDANTIIVLAGTDEAADISIDATVAEVTAIGDGSFTLSVYSLTEEGADYVITDAAAVELANYEASSETEEISVDSSWIVQIVEDGAVTEGTSDGIAVGDVIVIYTDADGIENVVVYHNE